MAKCTVVIPYYQREPQILRRALRSVFAQTFADFDVVIVDDASPLPVESEVESLDAAEQARIRIIHQANAGPGGARNTGLDHVPAESAFVAFLDSDDEWAPRHLEHAITSLSRFGGDCYWATIEGGEAFDYHFGIERLKEMTPVNELGTDPSVVEVPGLIGLMLESLVTFQHMSCMVIGRPVFEQVRFEPDLRLAGEDLLFFFDCVKAAKRVILCDAVGALRGQGMNIFHSVDNDSPQYLRQQFNGWVALSTLGRRFVDDPKHAATIRAHQEQARYRALWSQMRLVRRRRLPQFGLLAEWARRDPRLLLSAIELAARKISRRGAAGETA